MINGVTPYKILANKDQLEAAGLMGPEWYVHTHNNGKQLPNRVARQFTTFDAALNMYNTLRTKHLIALKNWLS